MSRTGCTLVRVALTIAVVSFVARSRSDAQVVASTKDGSIITRQELDDQVGNTLMAIRTQLYEQQRKVLMEMLAERLLDQEARRRQVSRQDLEALEIDRKVLENPAEEITRLYQMSRPRFKGVPEEQARKEIDEALKKRQRRTIRAAYVKQLMARAGARISLDAPRVTIAAGDDAARGDVQAPVTLLVYADFQCPYCAQVEGTLKALAARYPTQLRVVYKDYPLSIHKEAGPAAEAARCAGDQGKYWEMRDRLFAVQQTLSSEAFTREAGQVGLNADDFAQCMSSRKFERHVEANRIEAERHGVMGTPGFFVNGRFFNGVMSLDGFQEVIDEELARVQAPQTVPSAMAGPAATGRSERR
jgi:protein-disulfide isomerase